jgi:hypothetical protein
MLPFYYSSLGGGNSALRPGDVKYIDTNGDGILDWKDQVEIGKGTTPHWTVGLNGSFAYKDFDLSMLFQGALGHYANMKLTPDMATYYDLRWREETNDRYALVPRLGGAGTNGNYSDYRLKKAGYLRLKTASLGYSLPRKWSHYVNVANLRVFLAGTNLLTFDKLKKYQVDPEVPTVNNSNNSARYYPQQRTVSLGVTVSF